MRDYINNFLNYLKIEKIASEVTIRDYGRGLLKLHDFLFSNNISDISLIGTRIIRQYIYQAKDSNFFSIEKYPTFQSKSTPHYEKK